MPTLLRDPEPPLDLLRLLERLSDLAVVRPRQSVAPARHRNPGAYKLRIPERTWRQTCRLGIFRYLAPIPIAAIGEQVAQPGRQGIPVARSPAGRLNQACDQPGPRIAVKIRRELQPKPHGGPDLRLWEQPKKIRVAGRQRHWVDE